MTVKPDRTCVALDKRPPTETAAGHHTTAP